MGTSQTNVSPISSVNNIGQMNSNVYPTPMNNPLSTTIPLMKSMSSNFSQPNQGYGDALGSITAQQQQQQQQQQMYHQQWGGNQTGSSIQPVNSQPASQQQQ